MKHFVNFEMSAEQIALQEKAKQKERQYVDRAIGVVGGGSAGAYLTSKRLGKNASEAFEVVPSQLSAPYNLPVTELRSQVQDYGDYDEPYNIPQALTGKVTQVLRSGRPNNAFENISDVYRYPELKPDYLVRSEELANQALNLSKQGAEMLYGAGRSAINGVGENPLFKEGMRNLAGKNPFQIKPEQFANPSFDLKQLNNQELAGVYRQLKAAGYPVKKFFEEILLRNMDSQ